MIVYPGMTNKRKTRKEKIKTTLRKSNEQIYYTLDSHAPAVEKNVSAVVLKNKNNEIKRILTASAFIIALNILLFVLLQTNLLKLGFLGY